MKLTLSQLPPSWIDQIGIPLRFRTIEIDPFHPSGVVAKGLEAMKQKQSVLIYGAPGRGKTFLASYWAAHFAILHRSVPHIVVVPELYRKGELQEFRERYENCPLLVLDDITRGNNWGKRDALFEIVNERWNRALPTIATTTEKPRELERMDAALYSRLASGIVLKLGGDDRRRTK